MNLCSCQNRRNKNVPSLKKQYGFDAISLMPTNLYGPGDNYHPTNSHVMASLISKFFNAKAKNLDKVLCWGSGLPKREFLYVEDLAKAVLLLLKKYLLIINCFMMKILII